MSMYPGLLTFAAVLVVAVLRGFALTEASSFASLLCTEDSPTWYRSNVRDYVPPSVFRSNMARRLCALQTSALQAESLAIQLSSPHPKEAWTFDALLIVSALTESYSLDKRLDVQSGLPSSFQPLGTECRLSSGCLFKSTLITPPSTSQSPGTKPILWDKQRLITHYLRGAGLLWLRQRTIDHTGCYLAAHFAGVLLQPAGEFADLVSRVTASMEAAGKQLTCVNMHGEKDLVEKQAAIPAGAGPIILLGASESQLADFQARAGDRAVHAVNAPKGAAQDVVTALLAFAVAHCSQYVGPLDDMWVKVGLLLAVSLFNRFPLITSGSSKWKDDYGFASCTAEEFRVDARVLAGRKKMREQLELPPQPPLPPWDYVSSRPGWSGRNSDPKLCKDIHFPPPAAAIGVDTLIANGENVSFDCTNEPCPKILPLAPEVRGAYDFNGVFSESQRDGEYAGTAQHYRCGYMAPSGFDLIRDYEVFQRCKVVVVNLVAKGRDVLLNVQNIAPHNIADPRVCFVSIMDINGMITHQQSLPEDGGLMKYGNWTVVALLNSPWEGTTDGYWIRGARDANVMRHLRFRTFQNAAYSMWIDGKHQLVVDPCTLFDQLLNQKRKLMANFNHENRRCVFVEQRIIKGLGWTSLIPGYRQQIQELTDRYHREGMPSEAGGSPQGAYDLAVIISRHTPIANMHSCMAYSEIESFTSRNQLHFPYTVWRAKTKRFMHEAPNCASWIYTKHVGHWSDHGGNFKTL